MEFQKYIYGHERPSSIRFYERASPPQVNFDILSFNLCTSLGTAPDEGFQNLSKVIQCVVYLSWLHGLYL